MDLSPTNFSGALRGMRRDTAHKPSARSEEKTLHPKRHMSFAKTSSSWKFGSPILLSRILRHRRSVKEFFLFPAKHFAMLRREIRLVLQAEAASAAEARLSQLRTTRRRLSLDNGGVMPARTTDK
jgi:hypothetical protein